MPNSWTLATPDKKMTAAQVHIWQLDLTPSTNTAGLYALLSPEEKERFNKFKRPQLATRFMHAHAGLRLILSGYCALSPDALRFDTGNNGKPYLLHPATAPKFNLSHSGDRALVAVSLLGQIGVDIEENRVIRDISSLVYRFFSTAEKQQWQQLPHALQQNGFYKGWTSKEAFIKALGGGLSIPLDAFSVDMNPDTPPLLVGVDASLNDQQHWCFHNIDIENGFSATVVTSEERASIEHFTLDWTRIHP